MDTLLAFCAALAAGPVCESLCHLPRPCTWHRARLTGAVALAAALFTVLLWVTLRPTFSALGVWAGLLALALTNNAKLEALREPLLADDRTELLQVVSHPGFYLPFLTRAQALGLLCAALAVPAALVLSAPLELSPLPAELTKGPTGLLARLGLGAAVGLGLWLLALPNVLPRLHAKLHHNPATDMANLGFFGLFGVSLLASWDARPRRALRAAPGPWPRLAKADPRSLPHIVAVQAEAFYDVGRLHPELADLLPGLEALRREGALVAPLVVPAFGANTIRTEFAFLSGLAPGHLGLECFQPYARLARRPMDALPRRLAAAGYRTVCLHPNSGAFYRRNRVMPNLGFQEFLDLPRLGHLESFGPHASDAALARYALEMLSASREPLFLFLVSMENHSPWLPGRLAQSELADVPETLRDRPLAYDTRCYLRHLMNADTMLTRLTEGLHAMDNDGGRWAALCFYGDHQPNLTDLQRGPLGQDRRSDAVLWRSDKNSAKCLHPPGHAHELPLTLLRLAVLATTDETTGDATR